MINKHTELTLTEYLNKTAALHVTPAGGSAMALAAALGAALTEMVAIISTHREGLEDSYDEFNSVLKNSADLKNRLSVLIDADSRAVQNLLDAFRLPQTNGPEISRKKEEIQKAALYAIEVPLELMRLGLETIQLSKKVVESGFSRAITDAAVGAMLIRTAVTASGINIHVNGSIMADKEHFNELLSEALRIEAQVKTVESEIFSILQKRLSIKF